MKRSKILLGLGVLLLGTVTAMASSQDEIHAYYYHTGFILNPCTSVLVSFECELDSAVPCFGINGASAGKQLYLTDDCD